MGGLGVFIRTTRENLGITLTQLSDLSGVSQTHLTHIELSKRTPSLKVLENLSKSLSVPLSLLIEQAGYPLSAMSGNDNEVKLIHHFIKRSESKIITYLELIDELNAKILEEQRSQDKLLDELKEKQEEDINDKQSTEQ